MPILHLKIYFLTILYFYLSDSHYSFSILNFSWKLKINRDIDNMYVQRSDVLVPHPHFSITSNYKTL